MKKIKAFTLAEIMIVLVVIGVLAAILLPAAFKSRPDEKVAKLKKANMALYSTIRELVTSDKYYLDGDLGVKIVNKTGSEPITTPVTDTSADLRAYFCKSLADILSTKSVNCRSTQEDGSIYLASGGVLTADMLKGEDIELSVTDDTIKATKAKFDADCKAKPLAEIITTDGVVYYQTDTHQFGDSTMNVKNEETEEVSIIDNKLRFFSPPNQMPANIHDKSGFDIAYKTFCIDVDGVNSNCDDVKDLCPFGYGIRADGAIMTGTRVDTYLAKSIQKKD